MTFIASVIAKDGVAVIADSLMTTSEPIITGKSFIEYSEKIKNTPPPNPTTMLTDMGKLFKIKKSYTKDYEEKLIEYDKYTCITFTGMASINGTKVSELLYRIIDENKKNRSYRNKSILSKVKEFKEKIESFARKHIEEKQSISDVTFIITHYDRKNKKSDIFKVDINSADNSVLSSGIEFVIYRQANPWETVVTDGQNRICDRILMGHLSTLTDVSRYIAPLIADNLANELTIDKKLITQELITRVINFEKLPDEIFKDVKMLGLVQLSLQQATDLAALLMRIEMDFQKYTEDIPSVGGVIKLATINKDGIEYHSGKKIITPSNIL